MPRRFRPVRSRPRLVVAGGGVAAVEAILAVRALAGRHVAIDLLAPDAVAEHRPASVGTPFGFGPGSPLNLRRLAEQHAVELRTTTLESVDTAADRVRTADGEPLDYDFLLLAHGSRPVEALPGATTFAGPRDVPALERILDAAGEGSVRRIAFAIPARTSWPLPAYELALMTAIELRDRGIIDAQVSVVTAERSPLWLFGPAAGEALRDALVQRGIAIRTNAAPVAASGGALELANGERLPADAVIALPAQSGIAVPGLPADDRGFLPTDAHGRVAGLENVLAAGDATAFPIKQGGLAAQQADAAAETIAAALGSIAHAHPFRPVLRGLLLTGGAPLYLRAELSATGEPPLTSAGARRLQGEVSTRALWWPPAKIAGRHLAPYLADARPLGLERRELADRAPTAPAAPPEHDEALTLALLLADEDASHGDLSLAVEALDAAAALTGGLLPERYAERRREWLAALAS
jgi:sulfide:quinone oxidoreductase